MMMMSFYWGTKVTILFSGWSVEEGDYAWYWGSLAIVFFFGVFQELLTFIRLRLPAPKTSSSEMAEPLLKSDVRAAGIRRSGLSRACGHLCQGAAWLRVLLYAVHISWSYLLMLVFMTYNGGVCIAMVIGLSIGYLFFRAGTKYEGGLSDACCN